MEQIFQVKNYRKLRKIIYIGQQLKTIINNFKEYHLFRSTIKKTIKENYYLSKMAQNDPKNFFFCQQLKTIINNFKEYHLYRSKIIQNYPKILYNSQQFKTIINICC